MSQNHYSPWVPSGLDTPGTIYGSIPSVHRQVSVEQILSCFYLKDLSIYYWSHLATTNSGCRVHAVTNRRPWYWALSVAHLPFIYIIHLYLPESCLGTAHTYFLFTLHLLILHSFHSYYQQYLTWMVNDWYSCAVGIQLMVSFLR